jgi:hypothetical protein
MTVAYALLIPARAFRNENSMHQEVTSWMRENSAVLFEDSLPKNSPPQWLIESLPSFVSRKALPSHLGPDMEHRYRVLDFGREKPETIGLLKLAKWIANKRPYGLMGFCHYWLGNQIGLNPLTAESTIHEWSDLATLEFSFNRVYWFSLSDPINA